VEVEDILHQLAMLSLVAILVTMPGRYPPCDEAIKWQSKDIRPTVSEGSGRRLIDDTRRKRWYIILKPEKNVDEKERMI